MRVVRPRWAIFENVRNARRYVDRYVVPELRKLYPHVAVWLLNAADHGVPQSRTRLFIVAGPRPVAPPPTAPRRTMRDAIAVPWDRPSPCVMTNEWKGRPTDPSWWKKLNNASDALAIATKGARRKLTLGECAALQTFPAGYPFAGPTEDRYRQVGNAVPPTLAAAVARTIRAAEEAAAQDPRNSPELREGSARRAENLKAAQVREEARAAEVEAKAQERRAQEAEQRDAEARERRVAERARIAAEVRAAAGPVDGDGWFTMTIMPGAPAEYAVRVPRLPFTCWALWRTNLADQMPPYSPVSESGMRLFGDDPYHNDWMIGAFPDRDVWDTYRDEEVRAASYGAMREIQREIGGFDAAVLSGRGYVSGHVVQPQGPEDEIPPGSIAVLPDARPHWDRVVRLAAGTIVPTGGELCHLAVVAGEAQRIIMRVPDCLQRYPHGQWVELDTETGRVTLDARTSDVTPIHPRFPQ